MPAVGKITLDVKDYEKQLDAAKKAGERAAQSAAKSVDKASKSVKDFGRGAGKAGRIVSAMGSSMGSSFGAVGNVISSLTAGPVAALVAGLAALAAIGVAVWDRLTLSAEEYEKKTEMAADRADKAREKLEKQTAEDSGYMERLQELAKEEKLSNEAKTEAANLIDILTARYGKLGIEIDAVTGRITGADKAQKAFLERVRKQRIDAVWDQMYTNRKLIDTRAKFATGALTPGEEFLNKFGLGIRGAKGAKDITARVMQNPSLDKQIEYAEHMRDNIAKTAQDIDNWQKVVELLYKQKELTQQMNNLVDKGAATEQEHAARQRKRAAEAAKEQKEKEAQYRKQEEYWDNAVASLERQLKIQQLINDGKEEEAERLKLIADAERQGVQVEEARLSRIMELNALLKEEKRNAESLKAIEAANEEIRKGKARLADQQKDQAESLYDRALRQSGRAKEADERAAIRAAEKAKGSDLTPEERKSTLELFSLTRQLTEMQQGSFGNLAIQTNALTARGGFQGAGVAPDADKYNRIIAENGKTMLSVVKRIETICGQFGTF